MLAVDREAPCSGPLAIETEEESFISTATDSSTNDGGTALEPVREGGGVEMVNAAAEVDLTCLGIVTM